jgi:hypothetical protein
MKIFLTRHYKEWRINNDPSHISILSKYIEVVMIRSLFILELLSNIYLKAFSVTMLCAGNPALSRDRNDEEKKYFIFFFIIPAPRVSIQPSTDSSR